MSGPASVEELIDETEIQDVIGRLARAQDRLDRAAILDCYHDDAEDDHNAFKGTREEFADWVIGLLGDMFEATNHFVGPSVIDLDGDFAQVNTVCICHHLARDPGIVVPPGYSPTRYDMWAGIRYLDRFERRRGEWRIARRITPYDWGYCAPFQGDIRAFHQDGEIVPSRDLADPSYKEI